MPTPETARSVYRKAVDHLMNFQHEQAVAEFTEAILLEPDAPNPYIGRAMAHRRLGNDSAAREDEQRAQELGGAERNAWERLCNRSRRRWRWDFDNLDWKREDPLSRNAVLLDKLACEIHNGGLWQWVANGHWRWIDDVILAAREIGTDATREVAAMLENLAANLDPDALDAVPWDEDDFDEDGTLKTDKEIPGPDAEALGPFEDRYIRVQTKFVDDVEQYFERKAPGGP
jgi:hypothetical protein